MPFFTDQVVEGPSEVKKNAVLDTLPPTMEDKYLVSKIVIFHVHDCWRKSNQIIYVLENPLQTSDHWKFTIIPPSRPGLFLSICQPFPLAAQFSFCRLQAGSAWALCKVLHHASAGSFHLFNWDPQPLKTSCRRTPEMSEKKVGEGKPTV